MAALRALGARTVPVVSKGAKYVFAQVIKDVVEFLDLDEDTRPELSPAELATRYTEILERAVSLVRQMPDARLEDQLPNRPRSWRVLMHHVFQIPHSFLEMERTGEMLTYEQLVAAPPATMQTVVDIAVFGEVVREQFVAWWHAVSNESFDVKVPTYFGDTTRHEMLERTVWHSTQHTRQIASLLEKAGVMPENPLTSAHIKGLPLTDRVWDE